MTNVCYIQIRSSSSGSSKRMRRRRRRTRSCLPLNTWRPSAHKAIDYSKEEEEGEEEGKQDVGGNG